MYHFVANLKDYTFHRGRGNRRFDSYLLSVDHAASARHLLPRLHREDRTLAADNGNVALIRRFIADHRAQAADLHARRADEELAGAAGDAAFLRPGDLSTDLQGRFAGFAASLRAASAEAVDESRIRSVVAAQEAMQPTYLIGMEDFTIATLTALGVEPEYSSLPPGFYTQLSERAAGLAVDTMAQRYGPNDAIVFAGLHAIDLDTARAAGEVAADADVTGVATGLVGALQDRTWTDYRVDDGRIIDFDRSVPRPYVRVLEIAAGLHEGYAQRRGQRCGFHALGVGTPILQPLLGLLGDGQTYTSSDSTAPVVDAWTSSTISLYVDDPAPLKYKAHRIAEFWLADDEPWSCPCPYCRAFTDAHPNDIVSARQWWVAEGRPRLDAGSMSAPSPLCHWLPLLSRPAETDLRNDAGLARVGHNHWVLQRLEGAIRQHSSSVARLREWTESVMSAYLASPASPPWKAAAHIAWSIADTTAAALEGADPQPLPS